MFKFESLPERYQQQLIEDAKTYLKKKLGNDGYKAKLKLCMDLTALEEAYTNKHLAVLADQFKRKELALAPKDFIRNPALFPRVGICALQHYDPFGLRQPSDATLKERSDTIKSLYRHLYPDDSDYEKIFQEDAPYYPWMLNHSDAIVKWILQPDEGGECSGLPFAECTSRNYPKRRSIVLMFCRAMGMDEFDELHRKLEPQLTHHSPVELIGKKVKKKAQPESKIKPLSPEVQQQLLDLCNESYDRFMDYWEDNCCDLPRPEFIGNLPRFERLMSDYRAGRLSSTDTKQIRNWIHDLVESAKTYIVFASLGYTEEHLRPWRNDVANFRFNCDTRADDESYIDCTDSGVVMYTPCANKTGHEQQKVCEGTDTKLYRLLTIWRDVMAILQQDDMNPMLFCMTDKTKVWIDESEQKGAKKEIGSVWNGLSNWRKRLLDRYGIEVPKYHTGCNAARHTSATNDSGENAKLSPKRRREAEEAQAQERGHSAATAAQVYDNSDQVEPEPNDVAQALVGLANQGSDEFANEEGFLDDDALANIDLDKIEARSPSPVQTRSKRARKN